MKRTALITLLALAILLLAACGSRTALTSADFTTRMQNAGHTVEDITQLESLAGVETFLLADTGRFTVQFLIYEEESGARGIFNQVQRAMEDDRGSSRTYTQRNGSNFNRFTQRTDGRFEAIARVENTLLVIETTVELRNEAQAILDLLGY